MIEATSTDGWAQHSHDRELHEQERRGVARRLLADYLTAVGSALRDAGLSVSGVQLSSGPDLEARMTLRPGPDAPPHTPAKIDLSWAEDTGWSISHHLLGTPATPWRYLHINLTPSPAMVARFVLATLADADDVGMPYPAQFRFRGQPLQPVIDALARQTQARHAAHSPATSASIDAVEAIEAVAAR